MIGQLAVDSFSALFLNERAATCSEQVLHCKRDASIETQMIK